MQCNSPTHIGFYYRTVFGSIFLSVAISFVLFSHLFFPCCEFAHPSELLPLLFFHSIFIPFCFYLESISSFYFLCFNTKDIIILNIEYLLYEARIFYSKLGLFCADKVFFY